ncbi:MAG: terminase small subunit [Clostridia bacterium]|nr:terminase small subunit [Clostridia bacterium]
MTDRDLRFADEYFVDYDAKNAAVRAGYSEKTARNAAAWIKADDPKKPRLRALIDQKAAELSRRTGVTAERVIEELAKIAFANVEDIADPETGKMLEGVERVDASAVAGIRVKSGEDWVEYEVKMHDKIKALDLLGKHLGLYKEKVEVGGAVPVVISGGELLED